MKKQNGFTLLELLVVLVIIGLLAGFIGPKYFSQIGKSERKTAASQIEAFEKALDQFRVDMARFPSKDEGLAVLFSRTESVGVKWKGPYIKKAIPNDPWGNAYLYEPKTGEAATQFDYEIRSNGEDGKPNTADDISSTNLAQVQ